ncbi:MAG: phosphoribosylformylglycinamidine synthase subunit PurS [Candidatus Cloacimonadaceae bacterium]|jgi:phosphoribosylformylglycinamidine synthase PurS subunit
MLKAKIFVQLKPSVLDPQGKAVSGTLSQLGFDTVQSTRISRYIEIVFAEDDPEILEPKVKEICDTLLANPNTEHYHFDIEKVEES